MPQPQQPYHDPSVRFEPFPEGLTPPNPGAQNNPNNPGTQAPLQTYIQGEANSIAFYQKLASVSEGHKQHILDLIDQKNKNIAPLIGAHPPKEPNVDNVTSFEQGLAFALRQESKLLREAAQIKKGDVIANKIADIAYLISLM
ncbi:MAG: hypothetical protein FWE21_03960 [Defluviitaleaceae bacterium]|nr:hypothetical protein [Defluviitaleaceae bacterium]